MGGWADDPGAAPIPPARLVMLPYVGPVPSVETAAPGYGADAPQAFMVEMGTDQPPLGTHFHVVDQFQVIPRGSGRLGRHAIGPGSVHYADRLTPYGLLAAGRDGLAYVTLRSTTDTGAYYMPGRRDDLQAGLAAASRPAEARRNLTFELHDNGSGAPGDQTLVEADDGLRVSRLLLAPSESRAVAPVGGSGAYLVVLAGTVAGEPDTGADHGVGALRWVGPGGRPIVTAGPVGAVIAFLQLPTRSAGSDPRPA